ncbi:hypothetical protein SNK03_012016 [Fusarium graminearum]
MVVSVQWRHIVILSITLYSALSTPPSSRTWNRPSTIFLSLQNCRISSSLCIFFTCQASQPTRIHLTAPSILNKSQRIFLSSSDDLGPLRAAPVSISFSRVPSAHFPHEPTTSSLPAAPWKTSDAKMSAPGPESVPTSADPRSHRPTKKRALTPVSAQAASVEALFLKPDQNIRIPDPSAPGGSSALMRSAPPEIVTNVQGSSAGAGSGEFHVYKASRRREYERLRSMDEDLRREKDIEEFSKDKSERDRKDEERTRKNREKREKMKARKAKKGKGPAGATDKKPNTAMSRGDSPSADNDAKTNTADVDSKTQAGKDASESAPSAQPAGLVIHDDDD